MKNFEDSQEPRTGRKGWRYLIVESDLKPGTGPARSYPDIARMSLERANQKAPREKETPNFPHDKSLGGESISTVGRAGKELAR